MNPYIDDDLETLAEHARRFATGRVAPGYLERDQTRVLDRKLMHEMGGMGFIAPKLPERYGGQVLGCLAAGVIHVEVAHADLSISYINLLASLNGQILAHHGKPEVAPPCNLKSGRAVQAKW
jgi:cyclohexanecarboxyl-CoA dehydrogenase